MLINYAYTENTGKVALRFQLASLPVFPGTACHQRPVLLQRASPVTGEGLRPQNMLSPDKAGKEGVCT